MKIDFVIFECEKNTKSELGLFQNGRHGYS